MTIAMGVPLGFLVFFLVLLLNQHAYVRIRPLGYFPPTAAILVLGVDAVTLLAIIGTILLLLPRIGSGGWGEVLILVGIAMFAVMFVAFGCAVLVRKLPKIRDSTRVFGPRRVRFSVRRTFISLGYLTIAGGIIAALMISYQVIDEGLGGFFGILAVLLFAFGLVGLVLINVGKRFHQATIEDITKSDSRLLVLYLRPFAADRTLFAREIDIGGGETAGSGIETILTFETYLGKAFRERIGPFVALGSPEDYLPPFGGAAVRTYADDKGWYEYFERLAGQAGCISMLVSHSDNLQRELSFIRREGLQRRLFIFTAKDPTDYSRGPLAWIMSRLYGPPPADHLRERPATWEHFAEKLGKLGFELGDDPGRGAVVTFDSGGKAMVLVKGAEKPSNFVEPIRDYLVQTFGLNLDRVGINTEAETGSQIEDSSKIAVRRNAEPSSSTCAAMTESPLSPRRLWRKAKSVIVAAVIGILIVGIFIILGNIPDSTGWRIVQFIAGLLVLSVVFLGKGLLGLDRREFWKFKAPHAKSEEPKGQSAQSDQPDLARLRRRTLFWVVTACVSAFVAYAGNIVPDNWTMIPAIALVIFIPAFFIAWRFWRVYQLELRRVIALQAKSEGPQEQSVQELQGQSVQGLQGQSVQIDQPPVLYLRSFGEDKTTAKRKGSWTEEEYLAHLLALIGPVIAIGRPGEKLPEVGAGRFYVNDNEWQGTVEGLMKSSRLVAIRTGRSSGLRWEFRKCVELLRPEQLLVVVSSEAELNEMLTDMGLLSPTTPNFQLGRRSIASIRGFIIFRESWKPFLLRVKSSRFWYTKQVDSSYIQPRLAYTLRPLFEQLGVPWPKPAISGRNLGASLSFIGILVWYIYLTFYPGAADKENAKAMLNYGVRYEYGREGMPQDYTKAREHYEEAAAKGNASAMNSLGSLYYNAKGVPQDYAKAREWYEKAAANGDAYAMTNLGMIYEYGYGVPQDYAKAREWYEKAAAKANASAMKNLGVLYYDGHGLARDYAKAHEWFKKAADKGDALAMTSLGVLYDNGHGVTKDYAKAREWYEKAAAKGDAGAMNNLGALYDNGKGVTKDYAKAREWYEKAADKGDAEAKANLEKLAISEASGAGRYAEALQLQETLAAKVEAIETKREGKPGEETAGALGEVAWYALFAQEFTKALTFADRAHALLPDNLAIETNRAHALMFVGRGHESKALYFAHKGKPVSAQEAKLWQRVIAEDFAEFRKAGLTHPMMDDIEKELAVSP